MNMKSLSRAIVVSLMSSVYGFFIGSIQCVIATGSLRQTFLIVPFMEGGICGAFLGLFAGPTIYFGALKGNVATRDWLTITIGTASIGWISAYVIFHNLGNGALLISVPFVIAGLVLMTWLAQRQKSNVNPES